MLAFRAKAGYKGNAFQPDNSVVFMSGCPGPRFTYERLSPATVSDTSAYTPGQDAFTTAEDRATTAGRAFCVNDNPDVSKWPRTPPACLN